MNNISKAIQNAQQWLTTPFDTDTQNTVNKLIESKNDAFVDAFYTDLEFGTGGMRGIMGVGCNRINKYTLGIATQGLSNYLKAQFPNEQIKVVIGFDCRNQSDTLAQVVADVFSANNIKVYLFEELRPTPEISYAIRHLNCHSGIVLTASHNPPEYNGYKVYWNDGGQLVPPHDKAVIDQVRSLQYNEIHFESKPDLIELIGLELDEAYQNAVVNQSLSNEGKMDLRIVFTSIHGTSIKSVPQVLQKAGFTHVHIVEEQAEPNGNFPTVVSPNPEEPEALKMALDLAEKVNADIVLGTDPDADRIGIGVRNTAGKMELLNGNQTAAMLTWFLLKKWQEKGKLQGKEFIAQTVVTSELLADIATHFGVNTYYCLTGFKWIADIIRKKEGIETFIGGGEESFGYMVGDFVRDKDSASSALICCELAAWAKAQGSSFYEKMLEVYLQHGLYQEHLISITKKGLNGLQEIENMMKAFRENPPKVLAGERVVRIIDYKTSLDTHVESNTSKKIDFPQSNVIQFFTDKGAKVTARPSGTEPKIKFYFSVKDKINAVADYENAKTKLNERIQLIIEDMELGI